MSGTEHRTVPRDHLLQLPGLEELPPRAPDTPHLFTVDVEEYYQVTALEPYAPRASWAGMESRLEAPMERLLELLARTGDRGTFFVLGCVAERHPRLVRRIAELGHEVASHGQSHLRVTQLGAKKFREEIRVSRTILEDLSGERVLGFRAPSFSLVPGGEWAFDLLLEEGYRYDSSLFPIVRPGYGHAGAAPVPHWIPRLGGRLLEVPPTTLDFAGVRVPTAGGAYFRLLPYALTAGALRARGRRGLPSVFYIHPWELDPGQPRLPVSRRTRIRHYGGLAATEGRLERLLSDFRFTSISAAFGAELGTERRESPVLVTA